ncbi:MAG TPA: PfkB family carbohydrate kinase [Limnochordales bacterium]
MAAQRRPDDQPALAPVPVPVDAGCVRDLLRLARGRRVAVVGDVLVDHYLYGEPVRISREAPVLILRYLDEEDRPGGAANAAANARALGGTVRVVGLVGDDPPARQLQRLLEARGIQHSLVKDPDRPTTVKSRIVAAGRQAACQQVLRVDRWESRPPGEEVQRRLVEQAVQAVREAETVILSEYGAGTLAPAVVEAVLRAARQEGVPVVADSRYRLPELRGVQAATPNVPEAESVLGRSLAGEHELVRGGWELASRLGVRLLVLTRGDEGMSLFFRDEGRALRLMPYRPREVYDVSGAGDTVVAAVALSLACGEPYSLAGCLLAAVAAGLVVGKPGVATPELHEVEAALQEWTPQLFAWPAAPDGALGATPAASRGSPRGVTGPA